ncbi:uncharacterized protein LOC144436645 [Glandiceps talaboti]
MSVTILDDSNRHRWCEFGYVLYYKTLQSIQDEETTLLSGVDPDTFTVENLIDTVIQSEGRSGQTAQIYTDDGKALTNDPWFNTWSLTKRRIESESLLFVVFSPNRNVHFRSKPKLSHIIGQHILSVHVMMDKTYSVGVDLTIDDIGNLKRKIYNLTDIPTSCQKLSIDGQNNTPLNKDLDENSTVMVALGSEFGEIYPSKSENFKADVQPCVTQTKPGLAMFYSALFVVAEHVEDYTNTTVDGTLGFIRRLTGFPQNARKLP